MTVTATQSGQAQTYTTGAAPAATSSGTISSDFDTFLKMLTAQIQNQDPLNPMDSSDFAVQLATFSQVEQQVLTNDLLVQLGMQMGDLGVSSYANLIGMEARIPGLGFFDGEGPVEIVPNTNALADEAYLIVYDDGGNEIQKIPIDPKETSIEWDGLDDNGKPYAEGVYTFEVESHSEGELLDTVYADTFVRITEARGGVNGATLVGRGGIAFLVTDIVALREVQDDSSVLPDPYS